MARKLRAGIVFALALVLVWGGAPLTAGAAVGGSIAGTVRESSLPADGVTIQLFTTAGTWAGEAQSGPDGAFEIDGLADGSYKLCVAGEVSGHVPEWYKDVGDFSSATMIDVTGGKAVSGLVIVISRPRSITGKVTAESGAPIAQARVELVKTDDGLLVADTSTDENGLYGLYNVPDGLYEIRASAASQGYLSADYRGNPVQVGAGGIQDADIVLPLAPTAAVVSGEVRSACPDGCQVLVQAVDAEGKVRAETSAAMAEGVGAFRFESLPPGSYRFLARCEHSDPGYYGGSSLAEAIAVEVVAGDELVGLLIQMRPGTAVLQGTVLDAAGMPVQRALVEILRPDGKLARLTTADGSGRFRVDSLGAWEYAVKASDPADELSPAYFGPQPAIGEPPASVSLPAGGERAGVDITLAPVIAGFSGELTKPEGGPMPDALVTVYQGDNAVSGAETGIDGRFRIGRLEPGRYRVKAEARTEDFEPVWLTGDSEVALAEGQLIAIKGALKPPRSATSLTPLTRPRTVHRGALVSVSARLSVRRAGIPVRLMRRAWWGNDVIGTYTTRKNGVVQAQVRVYQTLDLYWSFEGNDSLKPSTSEDVRLTAARAPLVAEGGRPHSSPRARSSARR